MIGADYPSNEEARLKALKSFHLLDSMEEEEFENITYLASIICQMPISLISLVDKDRQFFKSHFGLPISETSRDLSFCAHAIQQPEILFEVSDVRLDNRFHDNPFVTGSPNAVFYAGIPLVTNDGFALGTLCVIDNKPRTLTKEQKEALSKLGKQVMLILEARQKKFFERELKLFDFTFRNATIAMHFLRNDGTVFDFNEANCKLFGYTSEEFKNISIFDFSLGQTQETWKEKFEALKKGNSAPYITPLKRKDNSLIHVEIRSEIIIFEDIELYFSSLIDVTDKLKAEEDLKKSNQRYEYATLATSDVIWEADLIRKEIYISKNITTFFGHQVEEGWMPMENNIWRRNIHPDEVDDVLKNQYAVLDDDTLDNWQGEYQFKRSDGSYAKVFDRTIGIKDAQGKLVKMVGAMQDITKRKEEEERLKLMEAVILNAKDSVLITEAEPMDGTGPKILFVNPAFEQMTGYTKEEVIGKTPRILQNEHTDRKELERLATAMKKWETCEITVTNSKKNGDKFWVNFHVIPIADQKGWFTHWIALERDVTKQIEATQEKEKLVKELIESNLELKQFSYITSHNLRAPLTNLVAVCDLIRTDKITDALTLKLIESFKISTHRLNETLNDLIEILIIKEKRNLQTARLTFSEILRKINESLSITLLEKKVQVDADFSDAPTVTFTSAYLESIFINLFTNAIKYRHPDRDPIITIKTYKKKNGDTKLVFTDNGSGINMGHAKDKIFGLYKKFHKNADSKGIGLYLIHSQITALGGTIEVESEVNIGTTFTITFK